MIYSKVKQALAFIIAPALCVSFSMPVSAQQPVPGSDKKQAFTTAQNPQIQQVKPKKPVRIKLHRNANGDYTWDLTGDNVDDIVKADSRLRKLLKLEQ